MIGLSLTCGVILMVQWQATAVANQQVHACINEFMDIDCTSVADKVVFVLSAKFGQFSQTGCGGGTCCSPDNSQDCRQDVDDVFPGELDRYKEKCVNKTSCSIQAAPGEVRKCLSPYTADYVLINYYCGAADGSDLTTTTEKVTTPPSELSSTSSTLTPSTTRRTTTANPGGDDGPNIGAIVGGVVIAVLVIVAVILIVIFLLRRRRMLKNPPKAANNKRNVNGYDNKALKTDEEWELEHKNRQLGPVIVEQDIRPKNTNTLARPRKDMPPEKVNRPKRYSSAYRQSNGEAGTSPSRVSTTSQNGVTPPKGVSPASNGTANGSVPSSQKPHSPTIQQNGNAPTKSGKFEDVDLS